MRLETDRLLQNQLRLSREERDYIAGHALDSIGKSAKTLVEVSKPGNEAYAGRAGGSDNARKIAALSKLLGDIGWERSEDPPIREWTGLGGLFPVAQLRPWLEEWLRQDKEALELAEEVLEVAKVAANGCEAEPTAHIAVSDAQTKLGTGAILLARIGKDWLLVATKWPWPKTTLVREEGSEKLEMLQPGREAKHAIRWEYEDYVPKSWLTDGRLVKAELETAWLRGYGRGKTDQREGRPWSTRSRSDLNVEAADYAQRVVGGSTRPERPKP
jgi:hypothetical protein